MSLRLDRVNATPVVDDLGDDAGAGHGDCHVEGAGKAEFVGAAMALDHDAIETEEDAAVAFINPEHRLLTYPNKITQADFAGWVQERGLYFPKDWDSRYEPLFRMNDTGEAPAEGSTLLAARTRMRAARASAPSLNHSCMFQST